MTELDIFDSGEQRLSLYAVSFVIRYGLENIRNLSREGRTFEINETISHI